MRSDFLTVGDNSELVVSESTGTSRMVALTTSTKMRVLGCFTHHCSDHLSSCQLCCFHLCQFEDHEDELHQDVGDQLDEEDG